MANDNIKRYLDYDGLAYLINKFNSVIEANEYTTSEALNDLNRKIAEININDNTGGFPIIDADITQVDSIYTTTENLNELITPGQYIVDSSKIQYEEDNFVKTLYWLLSVDKVVYDNSESIIQTYYPLSYLSYNWYNIPVGGLLQRFYEGNNTWTDLQVAAPGDVDPSKFVTKNEFDTNINTINTSITTINTSINNINTSVNTINEEIIDINETIKGLSKTDNDTKCETGTIIADTEAEDPTSDVVSVLKNQDIPLSGDGTYLSGNATAVNVVTKQYVDQNFIPKSESDVIWEAINAGKVDSISLEKSGITKAIADEEVNIPYINNKISFTEGGTGSFVGKFDVISLPTKKYVSNNYVSNQTLLTTLNDYVDKASVIPNILKNGTPQAGDNGKNFSLQWFQTGTAITDTNSTDYNDICAPSYSDFNETTALHNKNSMVIRGFWTTSYFHDIWMSPNSDHIFHRSITDKIAKPWKILLDNENCGKYVKNVVDSTYVKNIVDSTYVKNIVNNTYINQEIGNNIIDIANFKTINIPLTTKKGIEIPDGKAIIGTNILDLSTALDQKVRDIHSKSTDISYNEYTDLSIILNNKVNNEHSVSESLSIGYYDVLKNKNIRIGSFYTYANTGRAQGRFDLDGELCVHDDDNKAYLIFEHNVSATAISNDPRRCNNDSTFTVKSYEQNYIIDNFYIRDNNNDDIFNNPSNYNSLVYIHNGSSNFYNYLCANNGLSVSNSFYCNPYASFLNSIGISNSKNIELVAKSQSKLPSDFNVSGVDLGTGVGDIIFYKNVGKTYKNPDKSLISDWPNFTGAQSGGEFSEHYGPMEICRIYPSYTSANRCVLNVKRASGLKTEGNPQNEYIDAEIVDSSNFSYFLQQNNVITNSNISNNLPSTVITTSNISSNLPSTVITTSNIASKLPSEVITTNNISHIEFKPSSGESNGGFIDFHYGGIIKDFTSRIIEDSSGTITISSSVLNALGKINAAKGVFETSDETLKDFQDSIQVNFEQLKEIPKAYFTFKDDKTGETKIGTSAQKVKEFYPELVSEDENGILSVDYAKLSMVALKAVDELDDRITKLEKLVEQLINK